MAFKAARKLFRELVRLPTRLKPWTWQEQETLQSVFSPEFVGRPHVEAAVGRHSSLYRSCSESRSISFYRCIKGFSKLLWQNYSRSAFGSAVSEWQKVTRLTTLFGAFGYVYYEHSESMKIQCKLDMSDALKCMQMILKNESHVEDTVNPKVNAPTSLKELSLNERLGNSSSAAAVYAAEYDNREYAVKIMFNYEHASNGHALKKGFSQECRVLADTEIEKNDAVNLKPESLPEHPNVIRVLQALVEETPCPSDALESYPIALPKRHFADGLGRNKTLFLIMPKYNCTLRQYITDSNATLKERKLLLAQLFEGVAHLVQNHESHRDLKTDNILLDTSVGDCPKLVITDFGCCLGDATLELKLPFETRHVDRGGNSALMAPEVAMAVPGRGRFIDYSKADVWACGAIAFEIFGESNPFTDGRLENRSYNEDDVKELWRYDRVVGRLIHQVLQRDPNERLTAEEAALMACIILYAPEEWWLAYDLLEEDVTIWFLTFWSQYFKNARDFKQKGTPLSPELTLQGCFLRRASLDKVLSVVKKFKEDF